MHLVAGLLLVGLLCNLAVRPVAERSFMSEEELARVRALPHGAGH
jgi:hypothetical protein